MNYKERASTAMNEPLRNNNVELGVNLKASLCDEYYR